jgi:hypothetical protein
MKKSVALPLLLSFFTLHPSAFPQGSLTPPGPPAPMMKTLQQIEPRIDLQNAPASAVNTTAANYHFIISQPGSYYLSANLDVTKTNGIQISVAGVSLDLNGFEISRVSGSGGNGIQINNTSNRTVIRNGSIRGFNTGINSNGTIFNYPRSCTFRDLRVSGCTLTGIFAGMGAVLDSCQAHDNSGYSGISAGSGSSLTNCSATRNTGFGIVAGSGSALINCTASDNTGQAGIAADPGSSLSNCSAYGNACMYGISAAEGSSLINCTASTNTADTLSSAGIATGPRCTLLNCNSSDNTSSATPTAQTGMGFELGINNTVQKCTAAGNKGHGIVTGASARLSDCNSGENGASGASGSGISANIRAVVSRCTTNGNRTSGIVVLGGSLVSDCTANVNGNGLSGDAGINSTGGSGSRIEANQARDNAGIGIATSSGDIVIRNSAGANSVANFSPSSGANFAPIQTPSTATNPLANIVF